MTVFHTHKRMRSIRTPGRQSRTQVARRPLISLWLAIVLAALASVVVVENARGQTAAQTMTTTVSLSQPRMEVPFETGEKLTYDVRFGGIKVGTFSLLFVAMLAALRGRQNVSAFGRAVPHSIILQAMTIALLGVAALFALTMLLLSSGNFSGLDSLVEVGSALGTVGLSTGITPEADWFGRAVLITGMLVGRFGPLILVLEMTRPRARSTYQLPEDSIRIG